MSKSSIWGLILTMLVACYFGAGFVHTYLEGRARPVLSGTPETALHPVNLFKPSTEVSSKVQASEEIPGQPPDFWVYSWAYTTPASTKEVMAQYQAVYKDAKIDTTKPGITVLQIVPAGASPEEKSVITVTDGTPTHIDIQIYQTHVDTVPSVNQVGTIIFVVMLVIFFVAKGGLSHVVGAYKEVAKGTRYDILEGPPTDGAVLTSWREPQRALERAGYKHAYDYSIVSVAYPNFARLLHHSNVTFAALTFAKLPTGAHRWIEMITHCTDGTSVVTTTSKFPAGERPPEYPLFQMSPDTSIEDLTAAHRENVLRHEGKKHVVTPLAPERVLKLWQDTEKIIEEKLKTTPPEAVPVSSEPPRADEPATSPEEAPGEPSAPVSEAPAAPKPLPPVPKALPAAPVNFDSPEKREAFCNEVMDRIRGAYPQLTLNRKEGLVVTVTKATQTGSIDLDLTSTYAEFRTKPEGVIGRYVTSLANRM